MQTEKIPAADVAKLRKMTGAGMMDSKKALEQAQGDFERATDILRKNGQKIAVKRADRDRAEGVVVAQTHDGETLGIMLSLNCETDFVAKNEDFMRLSRDILDIAVQKNTSSAAVLLDEKIGHITIREKLTEQTGVIGERIEIDHFSRLEAPYVGYYIHSNHKIGALVGLSKRVSAAREAARNIAMQVVAMNPIALDEKGVSEAVVARELEIGREWAIRAGKPAELAARIAQGRLRKFLKENTLVAQTYIKDEGLTVEKYLQSIDGDLKIVAFEKIALG